MSPAIRTTLIAAALALVSAAVLVVLAHPAHAAGKAEVRFAEPELFTDAGRNAHDRDRALASLSEHVQRLAAQRLPDGQRLRVQFLDVDLAGTEILRRAQDVRVMRGGADRPRLQLRWTLEQDGRTLKSGEERLSDSGYLSGRLSSAAGDGDLPYEKRLLTQWFHARFEAGR